MEIIIIVKILQRIIMKIIIIIVKILQKIIMLIIIIIKCRPLSGM